VRLEGLGKLKESTSSALDPATFRLVAVPQPTMLPCAPFGGTCCLYFQSSSTLKIKEASTSEMSVIIYKSTKHHNTQGSNLQECSISDVMKNKQSTNFLIQNLFYAFSDKAWFNLSKSSGSNKRKTPAVYYHEFHDFMITRLLCI
jgi:hypothetical protein